MSIRSLGLSIPLTGLALVAGLAIGPSPASAQAIVAIVNGAPISTMDVQSRSALMRLSGKPVSQREVVEELIEERLKMLEARRVGMLPGDREVDATFASIAARSKLTPAQLTQGLASRGVSAATLKARIRAEMGWGQFVRQKFRAQSVVREQDVVAALQNQGGEAASQKTVTYTIRQVIFVLPKDAPEGRAAQRRQEAAAARSRFTSCEQGVEMMKSLRDVAVKEPIIRTSTQLPPALRDEFDKTPVGRLTAPDKGDLGIEMLAICEKKESTGTSSLQQQVELKLNNEQMEVQARKYLNDLKARAIIEYRMK